MAKNGVLFCLCLLWFDLSKISLWEGILLFLLGGACLGSFGFFLIRHTELRKSPLNKGQEQ